MRNRMLSPNNHSALTTLRFHLIEPPSQEFGTYRQLLQDEQIYVTLGYCLKNGRLVHAPCFRLRLNDYTLSRERRGVRTGFAFADFAPLVGFSVVLGAVGRDSTHSRCCMEVVLHVNRSLGGNRAVLDKKTKTETGSGPPSAWPSQRDRIRKWVMVVPRN